MKELLESDISQLSVNISQLSFKNQSNISQLSVELW